MKICDENVIYMNPISSRSLPTIYAPIQHSFLIPHSYIFQCYTISNVQDGYNLKAEAPIGEMYD